MKLVVGTDERTQVVEAVVAYLHANGHRVETLGCFRDSQEQWRWVEVGRHVAESVVDGRADFGLVWCWSGTGVCMAANKVKGARAALCWDAETARLSRKWNDANVLCMSLRYTSYTVAKEIVEAFLNTKFDEEGLGEAHKLEN